MAKEKFENGKKYIWDEMWGWIDVNGNAEDNNIENTSTQTNNSKPQKVSKQKSKKVDSINSKTAADLEREFKDYDSLMNWLNSNPTYEQGEKTKALIEKYKAEKEKKDLEEKNKQELNEIAKEEQEKKNLEEKNKKEAIEKGESAGRNFEKIDTFAKKNKFSNYINSESPSTFGLIFGDSGLSFGERLGVGLSALGSLTGDVLLANGKSLLGDNSLFEKIGSKVGIENFTTKNKKDYAESMNNAIIETAKQTTQNKSLLDKLFATQKINMQEEKIDYLAYFTNVVGSMTEQEAIEELERNGFSTSEAKIAYKNCQQVSKATLSGQNITKGATEVEKSKLDLFNQSFKTEEEINNAINQLQKEKQNLLNEKKKITQMDFSETIAFAQANRSLFQGIASRSDNSSTSNGTSQARSDSRSDSSSHSNSDTFGYSANAGLNIPVISLGGGVNGSSTESNSNNNSTSNNNSNTLNFNSASGFSSSVDYLAKEAVSAGKVEAKKWWKEHGKDIQKAMSNGIDGAIQVIDQQIEEYQVKKNQLNGSSDENLKNYVELNDEERSIWRALTNLEEMEFLSTSKDFDELYYKLTH